jgi:hypothetical protein
VSIGADLTVNITHEVQGEASGQLNSLLLHSHVI